MKKVILKKIESVDKLIEYINNDGKVVFSNGKEFGYSHILNSKLSDLLNIIRDEVIFFEIHE